MQAIIFSVYYIILLLATIAGVTRYRRLDPALRIIVILLILTVLSESVSYALVELEEYGIRYSMFHIYSMIQLLLISLFFIYAIKPYHYRKLIVLAFVSCPLIGILNIIFFQPIDKLNNFMLMFESFAINSMALYFIYYTIKNTGTRNIFKDIHVRIALLLLVMWSSTFFFWAFISVLFIGDWQYADTASHFFMIINILIYGCLGILIYTTSKIKYEYNR